MLEARAISSWERRLLPGELIAPEDARRSSRDWAVDVLVFAVAAGLGVLVIVETWAEHSSAAAAIDVVLGVVALVAMWWRRERPALVGSLVMVLAAVSGLAAGASLVVLFNAAIRVRPVVLARLLVLTVASLAIYPALYPAGKSYDFAGLGLGALLMAFAVASGLFVRARRSLVLSLHERAVRAEAEQQLRLTQARDAERRRIAREMHDVLGHRVSLLALHAGALEFRPDASPEEVAEAAGVIRATARATLQELREVIGLLREDGVLEDVPEPPQPDLAALTALVADSRAAGMEVAAQLGPSSAPIGLQRTAYRVVQEGLTNAQRHAPAAAVRVSVAELRGELRVEVVSRPAVGVVALPGGAGTGLAGLGERVEIVGGTLAHGVREDGDFVLAARLPWPA